MNNSLLYKCRIKTMKRACAFDEIILLKYWNLYIIIIVLSVDKPLYRMKLEKWNIYFNFLKNESHLAHPLFRHQTSYPRTYIKPSSPLNRTTYFNIKYRNITSPILPPCKETPAHLSTKILQLESTLGPPEDRKAIFFFGIYCTLLH